MRDKNFGAWLYSFENESWIVVSQEKLRCWNYSNLSRPSAWFKSKTAHFYLKRLFNALNMVSALRLTYLTCWAMTRVEISGTTAKSRIRKFVPSSHPGPFAVVASSRKRQTKVGTLACFDFCKRMSLLCKNPAMLFHVDMIYLVIQTKRAVKKTTTHIFLNKITYSIYCGG